jgi:hypothetical protein
MKSSFRTIQFLTAAILSGIAVAAQAQVVVSDNYESYTAGTSELTGYSSTASLTAYSLTVASGTGVGGSQGLTWAANFTAQYSGTMGINMAYYNTSGNTDPNLNDYTLSFEMSVPSGVAVNQFQLGINGWAGLYFTGATSTTGTGTINTSGVGVGSGFQLITLNLGAFNTANSGTFNPLDITYQIQLQLNGWQLAGGGPVTGEQMTIDNLQIQAVPEPTTLALAGLGAAGLLAIRRRKV